MGKATYMPRPLYLHSALPLNLETLQGRTEISRILISLVLFLHRLLKEIRAHLPEKGGAAGRHKDSHLTLPQSPCLHPHRARSLGHVWLLLCALPLLQPLLSSQGFSK